MVFLTSLQSIMPIVLLISLGYFLKGRGMFNDTFSSNLSRLIMSVILPVGVFMSVASTMCKRRICGTCGMDYSRR